MPLSHESHFTTTRRRRRRAPDEDTTALGEFAGAGEASDAVDHDGAAGTRARGVAAPVRQSTSE